MKKHLNKTNIITCFFLVLLLILSFTSQKISNSLKQNNNVIVISKETSHMTDEEVWNFLASLDDINNIGQEGTAFDMTTPIVVQQENDKEDPEKIIKQNEEKKGVAKKSEAKAAVAKYETNETSFGIDVSTWQKKIDWKKVKQSGVTFAMIRAGFRKLDSGTIVMDNRFLDNIKGAIANNINVGVYFFSMARDSSEALEEAKWLVNVVKDYDITYPLAIDIEVFNQNRLTGISYSTMTDNALVFCEYVKKMGYTPMIYSYANAFTKFFNTAKFSNNRIWLAQYNDTVTYRGKYHMWQYTSDGSVPGINGRVDMNVAYFSVTNDVTKSTSVNGINNAGNLPQIDFIDMNMPTNLTKTVMLRSSPYTNLPNKAGTIDPETDITVTGMSDDFIRIKYNTDTFYINDTECFKLNKEEVPFKEQSLLVKLNKEVTLLKEPYDYLKNNIVKQLKDEEITITGLNPSYVRIEYEEEIYYIKDTDFYTILKDNNKDKEESPKDEETSKEETPNQETPVLENTSTPKELN